MSNVTVSGVAVPDKFRIDIQSNGEVRLKWTGDSAACLSRYELSYEVRHNTTNATIMSGRINDIHRDNDSYVFDNLIGCSRTRFNLTAIEGSSLRRRVRSTTEAVIASNVLPATNGKPKGIEKNAVTVTWDWSIPDPVANQTLCHPTKYETTLYNLKDGSKVREIELPGNATFVKYDKLQICSQYEVRVFPRHLNIRGTILSIKANTTRESCP